MAEAKPAGPAARIRMIVLATVIVVAAFFTWRQVTRVEGYAGGDVVTTGTVEAVHVDLSFNVPGRLAEVLVAEGDDVRAGDVVARLETQDLEVQVGTASAALEMARASLAQARANRVKAARDLKREHELMRSDATTQQQLDAAASAAEVVAAQVGAATAQVHQAESAL